MKIDNTKKQWVGCWDETVNHKIHECSKMAQKSYKSWHDRLEKGSTGNCARD